MSEHKESARESSVERDLAGPAYQARVLVSPSNRRIQVLDYRYSDPGPFVAALRVLASREGLSKVFMKAKASEAAALSEAGMVDEARIGGYFDGEDAAVVGLFLDERRATSQHAEEERAILEKVREKPPQPEPKRLSEGYALTIAGEEDMKDLAELYREVFASYPYPIHDPAYLDETRRTNVLYRLVRDPEGQLVAAASAERVLGHKSVEMTDFATLPSTRGLGLALTLLVALEADMLAEGTLHHYTIARARSFGMNRVFYNRGYALTGTLVNNCHISGDFEDMHVWSRTPLS